MKIEKLTNNTWRARKQINGIRYSAYFDHKPTQIEAMEELIAVSGGCPQKGSFETCAKTYIESKKNVLSPSTVKGYSSILNKSIPDNFKKMQISKITQTDIQMLISNYSVGRSPKTVRNLHGFVSAVLKHFNPRMVISTTLPQKTANEHYIPTEEDIKRILEASSDNPFYHIPFQLGVLGMRRSEVCAAELSDIEGNTLHITKALVSDSDNNWVIKSTKTYAGTRDIILPDSLIEEILANGKIYEGYPNTILLGLHDYQDKLSITRFRFHDLRHFYASYCHSKGMTDADIMASGGWKSDYTMKSIYRHEMKVKEEQKRIIDNLFG